MLLTRLAPAVALIAAGALIGCQSRPQAESKLETKAPAIGWRPIGSWSGRGNTQTESFNIESGYFRVKWETKNEPATGKGTLKVLANSAVSGRPIAPVVEHRGVGRGTGYVSDDPRMFYLLIESTGVEWSLTVEEGVAAVSQIP
jgi:hypothetical protein